MKTNRALTKHLKMALPVAREAALKAGALIHRKFGKFRTLNHKSDQSLVTEVDKACEKMILKTLKKKFPNDFYLGEEGGASKGISTQSPFRWHIDPLDGTSNFVHGFPFFCVSIGLEYVGEGLDLSEPVMGVICQPMNDCIYTASKGSGAYRNKKPIHVSKVSKLGDSLLCTGFSFKRDEIFDQEMQAFSRMTYQSHGIRRTGSAALDLTHVAMGCFDGFWERALNTWDIAAGLALLTEAGGHYTCIDGSPFRFGNQSIVASNGRIHRQFLKTLQGRHLKSSV